MQPVKKKPRLILGSSSPRRVELLKQIGYKFTVIKPEVDEIPKPGETPRDYVHRNSREKSQWVTNLIRLDPAYQTSDFVLISADTIVVIDDQILEKPRDNQHATQMLNTLSGRVHTVLTGVRIYGQNPQQEISFINTTEVKIKDLTPLEITSYINTGEPFDKAGAYAAQGIGSYMIEWLRGSFANVVGLPVCEVVTALQQNFALNHWEA